MGCTRFLLVISSDIMGFHGDFMGFQCRPCRKKCRGAGDWSIGVPFVVTYYGLLFVQLGEASIHQPASGK